MDALVAGVWLDDWILEERLGEGGYASVWRARHAVSGAVAAIKLASSPAGVELLRQAASAPPLEHPAIVPVRERHLEHDPPYLVLELLEGGSLRRELAPGPLPPARALEVVEELAAALDFAHEHGRLHLDVKPENVLLDAAGRARLTDFGAAGWQEGAAVRHSLVASGQLGAPGTRDYAAPELREPGARPLDRRADVYSLGVLAFELLTARLPLGLDRPSQLLPGLPAAVDAALERALRRDPDRRTLSAGAFAGELRRALAAPLAAPAPAPPAARPGRPRGVGVVLALLSAAGLALLGALAGRAPQPPAPFDPELTRRLEAALPRRLSPGTRLLLLRPVDLEGRPVAAAAAPLSAELARRGLRAWEAPAWGSGGSLQERALRHQLAHEGRCELALETLLEGPLAAAPGWAWLLDLPSWTVLAATPPRDPAARELARQLLRALRPGESRVLAVLPGREAPSEVAGAFEADLLCALAGAAPPGLALRARAGGREQLRSFPHPALALSAGLGVELTLDPVRGEALARLIDLSWGTVLATAQAPWSPPREPRAGPERGR